MHKLKIITLINKSILVINNSLQIIVHALYLFLLFVYFIVDHEYITFRTYCNSICFGVDAKESAYNSNTASKLHYTILSNKD